MAGAAIFVAVMLTVRMIYPLSLLILADGRWHCSWYCSHVPSNFWNHDGEVWPNLSFSTVTDTSLFSLWISQDKAVSVGAIGPMILGSTAVPVYSMIFCLCVVVLQSEIRNYNGVLALAAILGLFFPNSSWQGVRMGWSNHGSFIPILCVLTIQTTQLTRTSWRKTRWGDSIVPQQISSRDIFLTNLFGGRISQVYLLITSFLLRTF